MPSTPILRRRMLIAAIVLAVLDLAALIFLFTPWGRTRRSAEAEYETTRSRMRATVLQVTPVRGIDKKLAEAQTEIADFYKERLPSEGSAIPMELGRVASENHVRISQVRYETGPSELSGLDRVRIDASLDGDYLQVVKSINALERDRMLFIVDSVTLGQEQGGGVRLQLKLETYLKGEV